MDQPYSFERGLTNSGDLLGTQCRSAFGSLLGEHTGFVMPNSRTNAHVQAGVAVAGDHYDIIGKSQNP